MQHEEVQRFIDEVVKPQVMTIPEMRKSMATLYGEIGKMEEQTSRIASRHQTAVIVDTDPETRGHNGEVARLISAGRLRTEKLLRNGRELAQIQTDMQEALRAYLKVMEAKGYDTGR